MKDVTPELEALLATGKFAVADLYTVTLFGGGVLAFTNFQVDITVGANRWDSRGVRIDPTGSRATARWKIGLDVDTWVVTVLPRLTSITGEPFPDKINGVPWIKAAQSGAFDNANVLVQRAYFAAQPTLPLPAGNAATPVGTIVLFSGIMGEVDTTDTSVVLNILDYRSLLTVQWPPNYFRSSCRHTLFDAGCQIVASNFRQSGAVIPGSPNSGFLVTSLTTALGSGTYALGRIVMTSGLNATFSRGVRDWSASGAFRLVVPFPYAIAVGDTFDAYPGCDKRETTCGLFANTINFGGMPDIPAPEVAV